MGLLQLEQHHVDAKARLLEPCAAFVASGEVRAGGRAEKSEKSASEECPEDRIHGASACLHGALRRLEPRDECAELVDLHLDIAGHGERALQRGASSDQRLV